MHKISIFSAMSAEIFFQVNLSMSCARKHGWHFWDTV